MQRLLLLLLVIVPYSLFAEDPFSSARVTGSFQIDAQYYKADSAIDAKDVPQKILSNSFFNLNYSIGSFTTGIRYEAYLNPILGYDERYAGSGIAYRFLTYNTEMIDITAGNFYEQFGSGIIFRSYEEKQLGIDNAMDGARIKVRPTKGMEFTGIIGKQRSFWDLGKGLVRGADVKLNLTDLVEGMLPKEYQLTLGGSFVSKFQEDKQTVYNMPLNVLAYSTRLGLSGTSFNLDAEYAYKFNDPSLSNKFTFNPGKGLIVNAAYFGSGYGFILNLHSLDNMGFRSDRDATGNVLLLNYIPPLTKQTVYAFANIYPFSTKPNGEIGMQAEATYTLPKGSFLGGEYGTTLTANYSRVQSIDTTHIKTKIDSSKTVELTYDSKFLNFADIFSSDRRLYFQDLSLEISRKLSSKLKSKFFFSMSTYDKDIMENEGSPKYGKVKTVLALADFTYKLTNTNALRLEFQHLWAQQDSAIHVPDNINGNWLMLLAEYTVAPHWYFTAFDQYNYGNEDSEKQIHYYNLACSYIFGNSRLSFAYGKQRGGILCVGGVCRPVPAANGFALSLTSSF